ncbi:hypothetical protein [Poseidonibacter ostreae]|uniref:Uncharacterized protein n=1 Tax=Poseidonibacter ostreae TaxID=2654171 RepID=A0ABQ6VM14_9BACT|nr:hypothetical protein [Poseidonibacter ostreae]KAB7891553.1 hypothetical protein GBG18_06740 [Poseidonibacter ostreae]
MQEITEELQTKINNYLNKSISNGWNLVNQNKEGFVIELKSPFSLGRYFVAVGLTTFIFAILSLLLGFFISILGLIISSIVYIFVFRSRTIRLNGVIQHNENKVVIFKNNSKYKEIV